MRALALAPLLLAACTCPKPLCTQWFVLEITSDHWDVGSYVVVIEIDGTRSTCTMTIGSEGDAPSPTRITCTPGVISDTRLLDTAELADPDAVEIRVHTGEGRDLPKDLAVSVTWEGSGARAEIVRVDAPLDWDERPAPYGTCASGCFTATLDVALPGLAPQGG